MEYDFKSALEAVGFEVDPFQPLQISHNIQYDPLTQSFLNTETLQTLDLAETTDLLQNLGNFSPNRWSHLMTATELKEVPMKWYIDGIIPQGQIGIILAPPKSFKSMLTFKIALAIAQGEPLAGHESTKANVLFIQNENSESDEASRMRMMTSKPADGLTFDFSHTVSIERIEEIRELIEARNIKVVIIDPLYMSFDYGSGIFKKEDELMDRLNALKEFHRSLDGVTFILLHHTKKIDAKRKQGNGFEIIPDDAFGSTFLDAWREFMFCLTPFEWGSQVTILGRSFNPDFKLACRMNSFGFEVIEVQNAD